MTWRDAAQRTKPKPTQQHDKRSMRSAEQRYPLTAHRSSKDLQYKSYSCEHFLCSCVCVLYSCVLSLWRFDFSAVKIAVAHRSHSLTNRLDTSYMYAGSERGAECRWPFRLRDFYDFDHKITTTLRYSHTNVGIYTDTFLNLEIKKYMYVCSI